MTRAFIAMAVGSLVLGAATVGAGCTVPTTTEDSAATTAESLRRLQGEETEFLRLINEYRASVNAGPLVATQLLNQVAYDHSLDMATNDYFDHNDLAGQSPFVRMRNAGYKGGAMAENIAAGNATAAATFTQWKNSPGHDANMRSGSYRAIGIGVACNSTSAYKCYWTTDFGDVIDSSAETGGGATDAGAPATDAGSPAPDAGAPAPDAATPPPADCTPETESNNTSGAANALAPVTCGAIGVAGDIDWFRWSSSAPFALTFADPAGLQLTVWRYSNGWRIVSPVSGDVSGSYAAGSYYARITATSGLPAYRLTRTP
jgi:uncharacterized protein YkwD